MNNLIIKYINLKKRENKNKHMIEILSKYDDLNWERFNAVDGSKLPNYNFYVHGCHKTKMNRGQMGCFLSHYTCYEKFLRSKYKYMVVLEDDINFKGNFYDDLNKLINKLESEVKHVDLVYLARNNMNIPKKFDVNKSFFNDDFIYAPVMCGYGFFSYLITRQGATKYLNILNISKNTAWSKKSFIPVDSMDDLKYLGKKHKIYLNIYSLKNEITTLIDETSDTEIIR